MSSASAEEVGKDVKAYVMVFIALAALTGLTVAVSYLHLPTAAAVVVALIIATVKGSLVAGYFMHLLSAQRVIYWVLGFTVFFFIALMLLPILTQMDSN